MTDLIKNHLDSQSFMFHKLLATFMRYFDRHAGAMVKRIREDSRESGSDLKINLSGEKQEQKLGKAVDKFIDNIRIFSCFLADLAIYFYNLESLAFLCHTATDSGIILVDNPFLTREVIANLFIDLILSLDKLNLLVDLVQFQSRDPNELLQTNICILQRRKNWEDLGLPKEIFSADTSSVDGQSSFLTARADTVQQEKLHEVELEFAGDSQPTEENSGKDNQAECVDSGVFQDEQFAFRDLSAINSHSVHNTSLSILHCIEDSSKQQDFFEDLANETGMNILGLLQQRQPDAKVFSKAIRIFQQIRLVSNPSKKLCLLSATLSEALSELRKIYSEKSKVETKFKVSMELLLSILIYIIVRSEVKDIITEYTVMKVYFLLNKNYNHNKLVYLLKSAIKSINKAGVFLAKKIA